MTAGSETTRNHPEPGTGARRRWIWTRRAALLLLAQAVMVAAILASIAWPSGAQAHTPTTPCAKVARITGTTIERCRAARIRHASNHAAATLARKCRIATTMPGRLCAAIGAAIIRDRRPRAWATSGALARLLGRESSHDPNAVNDRSDACGWFQRLVRRPHRNGGRGCPWAFVVIGWSGERRVERVLAPDIVQARNGLGYIAGRYGSPERALAFHNRIGWY